MNTATPANSNLDALTATTGAVITAKRDATRGCTLANSTTYYFPFGQPARDGWVTSTTVSWAAAVVAVITVETNNFPRMQDAGSSGPADISDFSTAAGDGWTPQNAPSSYVPVTGSGNSSTAATVTTGGTTAGACSFDVSGLGSRRARIKVVVTTGGIVRCAVSGKE